MFDVKQSRVNGVQGEIVDFVNNLIMIMADTGLVFHPVRVIFYHKDVIHTYVGIAIQIIISFAGQIDVAVGIG